MRKKQDESKRVTAGALYAAADRAIGTLVGRLFAQDASAKERIERGGWSLVRAPSAQVYSVAHFYHEPSDFLVGEVLLDPSEPIGERVDFEYRRFAIAYPMMIPIVALPLARSVAGARGLHLQYDPLAPLRALRHARDPGVARRVLRSRGWSNRQIKRTPIGQIGRTAAALAAMRVAFVVEASFTVVDLPRTRQIVFSGEDPGRLGAVLVEEAIRKGERFRIGGVIA